MQMQIPHSLVVLVVSLGLFASATPQFGVPACPFEEVAVPVEVVKTCPQPEIISIKTVYRTVKELVPDCGCTDDFTDFANVQLIADTACRNGLVFSPGLKTRKRGLFERSPACQSFSIVEKKQEDALKRRDGVSGSDLSELIHGKFDSYSENFRHNVDQNINNNGNIDEDDTQATGAGGAGFGGFGGFAKAKRQFGFGGFGFGGGADGGSFDDNDNQNINQNVNANQNLMANLGKFNSFFGQPSNSMVGSSEAASAARNGLNGLGFGNNENTDFNVNNNVAFEDTGFFKNKRSLDRRQFGFADSETFSDNNNQNINQNINNNQNLNEDFFSGVFSGSGGFDNGGFDNGFGFVPLFFGSVGDFGGFGDFGGYGGFSGGNEMNENFNFNPDVNGNTFGGSGFVKRSPCGSQGCGSSGSINSNVNSNTNINNNVNSGQEVEAAPVVETVVETVPVVETVYQPTVEYQTFEYVETVPVVEEVYEPVKVIEQVARPAPTPVQALEPVIPQIKAKVIEEKFNLAPAVAPVATPVVAAPAVEPVTVVETVAQPQVEVVQPVEVVTPIEVITPVAVEVQPVIEYEAVFFEAPSCGVPNYPTYTAPKSCSGNGYSGFGNGYNGFN